MLYSLAPTYPVENCACGNKAEPTYDTCEWCTPHDHAPVASRHEFTVNMLCTNCKTLAQDCCEAYTECPGWITN